jgi:predicted TIM-barrel fold metal-dependent hydrolase
MTGKPALPGQREAVSTPRTPMPVGAVDSHSHVLGPYAVYPLSEGRDYDPPEALVEQYRSVLRTVRFERSVIVQPSVYGSDNRATLAAVSALGPDKSRAVVMVPTDTPTGEIARLDDAGAVGVRFLTLQNGAPRVDGIERLAERIADYGWHLQCWMPPDEWLPRLDELVGLPVPVVFDHLAQLSPGAASFEKDISSLQRALDTGSVWVKAIGYRLSCAPFASGEFAYRDVAPVIRRLAVSHPERLLWGLDWPHTNIADNVPDDGALVDAFSAAVPDHKTFRRILVDNPSLLYRFD